MPIKKKYTKRRYGGIGSPKRMAITKKNMSLFPYTTSIMKEKRAAKMNAMAAQTQLRRDVDRAVWDRWTELANTILKTQRVGGKGPQRVITADAVRKYINANGDEKIDLHDTKQIMKQLGY
jgi:hypothetical protein